MLWPSRKAPWLERAYAHAHARDVPSALVDLEQGISRETGSAAPLLAYRGALRLHEGPPGPREPRASSPEVALAAEADLSRAIEQGHRTAEAYGARAAARTALGQLALAREDARLALRVDPDRLHAYEQRAWIKALEGDVAGFLRDAGRARQRDPDGSTPASAMLLALEAHLRGEPARAAELLAEVRAAVHEPRPTALFGALVLGQPLPGPGESEARARGAIDWPPWPTPMDWPAELVRFARGELGLDALLALADAAPDPRARRARRAAAHCWAGTKADRDGLRDEAQRHHRACVAEGVLGWEQGWSSLRLAGAVAAPRRVTLLDELERAAALLEQGVLTPEEFAQRKQRLITA